MELLVQANPERNVNTVAAPLSRARGIGAPAGFWFNADTLIIRAGDQVSGFYGRLADGIAITDDKIGDGIQDPSESEMA